MRPLLALGAALAVNQQISRDAMDYIGCAIELLHTYSLIHDDLPAMDDDDLRRGRPSCHKAFNEATAILVGDALQARAFELITEVPDISSNQKLAIIQTLSASVGFNGMVGGQAIDIAATNVLQTMQQLQTMHALKTGALIRAALSAGAIAADATQAQRASLDTFGSHIGLGFQVVDDILDVTSDTATLGKTQGKDEQTNKSTYVKLMGLEGSREEASRLYQASLAALEVFGDAANPLRELAGYIVGRDC